MKHLTKLALLVATLPVAAQAHGLHEEVTEGTAHLAAHLAPVALLGAVVAVCLWVAHTRREDGK